MKKPALPILASVLLNVLLSACSIRPEAALLAQLPEVNQAWQVMLPGQGGASLAVRLQPAASAFSLKASLGGSAAKEIADVQAYRVFLVSSASAPTGVLTPYTGVVVTVNDNNSGSQPIIFSNLPQGSFYACAAAFDSSSSFTALTNITEDIASSTTYAEGPVTCSSSGGESPSYPGKVRVDAGWQLLTSGVVGINLILRGVRGATIDARAIVQE